MRANVETIYTIGQLASAAGIPTSTVRFYERAGLLRPSGRSGANYRLYDGAALARLRFIRAALDSGFTVRDIAALLPLWDRNPCQCPAEVREAVRALVAERLGEVRLRLEELACVRDALSSLLDKCRAAQGPTGCPVLEELDVAASGGARHVPD